MEITNSQVGQNFAGSVSVPVQPAEPETAKQNQDNVQLAADKQKDIQVTRPEADTKASERQGQDLELAVREIEAFLQVQNRNLAFSVDENTQRSVVTVKDSESGDVIRQIPSDEVLRLADRIKDLQEDVGSSVGVLYNNKV